MSTFRRFSPGCLDLPPYYEKVFWARRPAEIPFGVAFRQPWTVDPAPFQRNQLPDSPGPCSFSAESTPRQPWTLLLFKRNQLPDSPGLCSISSGINSPTALDSAAFRRKPCLKASSKQFVDGLRDQKTRSQYGGRSKHPGLERTLPWRQANPPRTRASAVRSAANPPPARESAGLAGSRPLQRKSQVACEPRKPAHSMGRIINTPD